MTAIDINSDDIINAAAKQAAAWGLNVRGRGNISMPSGRERRKARRDPMAGVTVVKKKRRKVTTLH